MTIGNDNSEVFLALRKVSSFEGLKDAWDIAQSNGESEDFYESAAFALERAIAREDVDAVRWLVREQGIEPYAACYVSVLECGLHGLAIAEALTGEDRPEGAANALLRALCQLEGRYRLNGLDGILEDCQDDALTSEIAKAWEALPARYKKALQA